MIAILRRVWFAIVTVFVAATLDFFLFRVIPGSSVTGLRCQGCTVQFRQALAVRYGLDQPLIVQYWRYLVQLAHGDLGVSVAGGAPVWHAVIGPLLNTLPS